MKINSGQFRDFVSLVKERVPIEIRLSSGDRVSILGHHVCYFGESLECVAEDLVTHSLMNFSINAIDSFKVVDFNCPQTYKRSYEVYQHISNLRKAKSETMRLVLKVFEPGKMELRPPFVFLDQPYCTHNFDGTLIWAATIDDGPGVMSWLVENAQHCRVLSPSRIRHDVERATNLQGVWQGDFKNVS